MIDEIWPSPVALRLRMNRAHPSGKPDWSGCITIDGLNSRRRLEGILLGEVRADQQAATLTERLVGKHVAADLFETVEQEFPSALVAFVELLPDAEQKGLHLRLAERGDAGDDFLDSVLVRDLERPDDDAGVRRLEDQPSAFDIHVGGLATSLTRSGDPFNPSLDLAWLTLDTTALAKRG